MRNTMTKTIKTFVDKYFYLIMFIVIIILLVVNIIQNNKILDSIDDVRSDISCVDNRVKFIENDVDNIEYIVLDIESNTRHSF